MLFSVYTCTNTQNNKFPKTLEKAKQIKSNIKQGKEEGSERKGIDRIPDGKREKKSINN